MRNDHCLCHFGNTCQTFLVEAQGKEEDLEHLDRHFSCLTDQKEKTAFYVYYVFVLQNLSVQVLVEYNGQSAGWQNAG